MSSPELHLFGALAADLSKREARARASLPPTEYILGLGRYALELGPHVGVFARGTLDRGSGALNGLVVDFVDRSPETGRDNTTGKAIYRQYGEFVTVTDASENELSVNGLVRTVAGATLVRGEARFPGGALRVAADELDLLADFVYGDSDHPTAMHSFHFVMGAPGRAYKGIEVTPIPEA